MVEDNSNNNISTGNSTEHSKILSQQITEATAKMNELHLNHRIQVEKLNTEILLISTQLQELEKQLVNVRSENTQLRVKLENNCVQIRTINDEKEQHIKKVNQEIRMKQEQFNNQLISTKKDYNVLMDNESSRLNNLKSITTQQKVTKENLNQELSERRDQLRNVELRNQEGEVILRKLLSTIHTLKGNIRVIARLRPLFPDETSGCITVNNPIELKIDDIDSCGKTLSSIPFKLDQIFGTTSTQSDLFDAFSDHLKTALLGQNCSLLALGPSGSGKTYCLEGNINDPEGKGIILRCISVLFSEIRTLKEQGWSYDISVCYLEINDEEVKDLFLFEDHRITPDIKFDDKIKRVVISEVTTMKIKEPDEVHSLLNSVQQRRFNSSNLNNQHMVFQVHITGKHGITNEARHGTINIVELPASNRNIVECVKKNSLNVNASFQVLANVVCSLANQEKNVPYRGSKITHLLQYSFAAEKMMMLLTLSPNVREYTDSLNALKFASKITNCEIKKTVKTNK